jgi:hypothetical protein
MVTFTVKPDGYRWRIDSTMDGKQYRSRFNIKAEAMRERKRLLELSGILLD